MTAVADFPVKPEAQPYLASFRENAAEPEWLRLARRASLNRFGTLGFPSRRGESWRYVDLRPLQDRPLLPQHPGGLADVPSNLGSSDGGARLVLVDGRFAPELSQVELPAGIWFGSTQRAVAERPELVRGVAIDAGPEHPFASLNAAFFADGFVLDVPADAVVEKPIEIVHLTSGAADTALHTRSLVNLGYRSRATITETYTGTGRYWRNDFVLCRVEAEAALTRIVLIEEAAEAIHFGEAEAVLGNRAALDAFVLLLSGSKVRHELTVSMSEPDARCRINGAYLVTGTDEANIVTAIDHAAPGGETRELIKGVAADRGHGAFQGKIIVREHAQKTDAQQQSRNLMLGRRAVIDTKPELEIYADDVKCAHGATVGELDEAALFYLRTRGIPDAEARRMLIEGFLCEAVEGVEDPAAREYLMRRLAVRLARLEE